MSVHSLTTDETLIATGKLRAFVNIYPPMVGACGSAYKTRELADQFAGSSRIACIEIEYSPGDGIDDVRY